MGLLDNLMNDPEIGGRLSDISAGRSTPSDKYNDIPYSSSKGMREAYDEAEKFSQMSRGERNIYDK
ncbi:MAG: hypothetical protein LBI27_09620 [Clostridiales bacterium]|jgi:hypothetical protein|nr:hypothetical protein [Clostridiales bacterium]